MTIEWSLGEPYAYTNYWVASDSVGRVGVFYPSGDGPIPLASPSLGWGLQDLLLLLGKERLFSVLEDAPSGHRWERVFRERSTLVCYLQTTEPTIFFEEELRLGWARIYSRPPAPEIIALSPEAWSAMGRIHQASGCAGCLAPEMLPIWSSPQMQRLGFYSYWYSSDLRDQAYTRSGVPARPLYQRELPAVLQKNLPALPVLFEAQAQVRPQDLVPCRV